MSNVSCGELRNRSLPPGERSLFSTNYRFSGPDSVPIQFNTKEACSSVASRLGGDSPQSRQTNAQITTSADSFHEKHFSNLIGVFLSNRLLCKMMAPAPKFVSSFFLFTTVSFCLSGCLPRCPKDKYEYTPCHGEQNRQCRGKERSGLWYNQRNPLLCFWLAIGRPRVKLFH